MSRRAPGHGRARGARAALGFLAALFVALHAAALAAEPLPDPTRPPAAALAPSATASDGLRVESIWLGAQHRTAVVGGRRVTPGDALAGGRVLAIDLTGVRVRRAGGDDLVLTLGSGAEAQPARTKPTEPSRAAQPATTKPTEPSRAAQPATTKRTEP